MRRRPDTLRLLALLWVCGVVAGCAIPQTTVVERPRNVVFLLGDGMGFAQVKAYRMFADDPSTDLIDPLPFDAYQVGSVSTDSIRLDCGLADDADCRRDPYGFTDSASAATAYATGRDTIVGRLGIDATGDSIPTIFEAARRYDKATGLVATSQLTHASPAAFCSHVADREQAADIADQYFDNQWNGAPMVDVLLGGGLSGFRRADRDLVAEFQGQGYPVAINRDQMVARRGNRLLGLFADEGLPRALDRGPATPSLAEMTRAALHRLKRDPDGFLLFVEGSQVDWVGHDNSIIGIVSEMADFVEAARVILDFARRDGDTLVIITADHETGGLALGRDGIYRWDPRPLRGVTATPAAMAAEFATGDASLADIVADHSNLELSETERRRLEAISRSATASLSMITRLFNERTLTGWTTTGHTGVDVPLYVFGPGRARFRGVMQNEEVGRILWETFLPDD